MAAESLSLLESSDALAELVDMLRRRVFVADAIVAGTLEGSEFDALLGKLRATAEAA